MFTRTAKIVAASFAGLLASTASAAVVSWSPNIANFGGSDPVSSNEVMVWSQAFALPGVASFDSMRIGLAHDFAGDLTLRLTNNSTATSYYFFGSAANIGTNPAIADGTSNFDADELGVDGVNFGLADVVFYTLVPSGSPPTFITGTSGLVAPGSYDAQGWPSGSFAASNWTFELWDTWGSVDSGSLSTVALNYTEIPEPTTLGALAAIGLLALRRRA